MSFQLRPYQREAIDAVYHHLRTRDDNPVVVIPTAGGKTPVMASICRDAVTLWNGRVLILAHVRELLEQSADKLRAVCADIDFGIYSAGLGRRDRSHPVIIAGIQSVYRRATELGAFDLVMVDEAHLIPLEGDGMYRQFLADAGIINPQVRVVGFTATPFRLKSGSICAPEGVLNHVCYEVGVRELIRDGYLCPLVTKAGINKADFGQLHVRGGEFVPDEVEHLMDEERLVAAACGEIVAYCSVRHAVLIFASGMGHGQHVVQMLSEQHGVECGFITGDTPTKQRDEILARFRSGQLKYLCNVNVLTTGFDAPHIDCVVLLRPTMSPGLYYQMVGRGFRLHPGKRDCLVLDFGGNVMRHGPVDDIHAATKRRGQGQSPAKECPECLAVIAAGFAKCPQCGYEFPPSQPVEHDAEASGEPILSGQVTLTKHRVQDTYYCVHTKRNAPADAPKSMRVDYQVSLKDYVSEWICFEHTGYARQKAIAWWRERSPDPVPDTAVRAVELAESGALAHTESITVRRVAGERYAQIVDYQLGPLPEPLEILNTASDEDIPF